MIRVPVDQLDVGGTGGPDLTPMLDILFILLVFFLLTAGAVFQALDLTLPETVTDDLRPPTAETPLVLEIRADGYAVDGEAMASFDILTAKLSTKIDAAPEREVVIAGDKDASIQRLLRVLNHLRTEGVEAANILMKKELQ